MQQVSVVIPTFNRNIKCLRAVESVLNQTVGCEIIVVDDSSKVPFEFKSDLKIPSQHLLKIIRLERNLGVSNARNVGIKASTSEYIALLDSDDIWKHDKLQKQLDYLEMLSENYVVSCGWHIISNSSTKPKARIPKSMSNSKYFLEGCWFAPGSGSIMRKSFFQKVGFFDTRLRRLEDYEWYLRFASNGGKLFVVDEPLMYVERLTPPDKVVIVDSVSVIFQHCKSTHSIQDRRLIYSYLLMEVAVASFKSRDILKCLTAIAISFVLKPRLRLHLRQWWIHD